MTCETFVRADGALIPFVDAFDISTMSVKGVGEIGDVKHIDLQSPISSLLGKLVMKVGRSSGLTYGVVLAYALEYNDEKGICFLTDLLLVGENRQTFDCEGDSGSLIMLVGEKGEKPHPIGIIWGGTANRGRLKSKVGYEPENWTGGVDLGRLINMLELDLITTTEGLKEAVREQTAAAATTLNAAVANSFPPDQPLGLQHPPIANGFPGPNMKSTTMENDLKLEDGAQTGTIVEHQFILSSLIESPLNSSDQVEMKVSENHSALKNGSNEDLSLSLQLGDNEKKRRLSTASTSSGKLNKQKLEL